MMPKKSIYILVITLIVMAFTTVSCERSYTTLNEGESQATPTVDAGIEVVPTIAVDNMNELVAAGAQTSTALASLDTSPTATSTTAPTTDADTTATATPIVTDAVDTNTETPIPTLESTATADTPSTGNPASYSLERGEFPYCIARRFNIDPNELLSLNGLSTAEAQNLQPGLTLNIPQGGKTFSGDRAWHPHPDASYNVPQTTTVYAIACYFGDVDPAAILSANTISDPNNITAGTTLSIP
ncbi:MAG: LysM peptidoglycan-binding domain-containing protein [Anaerolineae bacterium]|jgi:LysM repeat protein|nr:LysM peptidoglycan-binding domain-containing protein [Anaerolineae bacterium]MBT7781717.1 LysM peptidoglycan-binding domain-containing protein [Anaerolineae bacterium]